MGVHWGKYEDERNVGFMFLVETALGRMRYIKMGNSSLTRPPDGFNSIAAKGRLEPGMFRNLYCLCPVNTHSLAEFTGHFIILILVLVKLTTERYIRHLSQLVLLIISVIL